MTALAARPAALARRFAPEIALIGVLAVLPAILPHIGGTYDIANRILDWGLFGLGFDLLFGFTGLLSFGQAAFYGAGGFVAAYVLIAPFTNNAVVALIAGTIAAAIFGVVIGYLSLRRTGIYFAMLTLAFGEMFFFLDISPLAQWTGGENGVAGVPEPHLGFGIFSIDINDPSGLYWLLVVIFVVGFWFARRIVASPFGAVLRAIRENGARVAAVGHDVPKYKLTVFVIAAAYAGLAGGLLGLLQGYMPPDAFYLDTSGQLVVQTIIGGAGTLIGPLVGAAVWLYLYTLLQNIAGIGALWKMILGIIFVLLVTIFRRGLCGGAVVLWRRLFARPAPVSASVAASVEPTRAAPEPRRSAQRPPPTGPVVLATRNLTKRYGGLTAVDDVSFELREGEIRAVIGPNGAGKSTFFNMLANVIPPTSGTIEFKGDNITGLGATLVCQRGISKSFQINQIFPSLTVRDNLRIAVLARAYGKFRPAMLRAVDRDGTINAGIEAAAASVQLAERLDTPAAELAYGEKRRLEIGLALATRPQILLLDEPTAGMSPAERVDTVRLLRRIASGVTIVIVEHDMDVVFGLADRITVLFNGHKIAEDTPDAIQANPDVRAAYLGSQAAHEPA
ncbi:MAG: branched-chain amino acid ABC transporter ATP-binding protein/permease [Alphaproteobacteria bacterium]|nr:branched-chain amino acid ABC transporter ATP-binding protein/permease [Alphaproteobacteria bacterium]